MVHMIRGELPYTFTSFSDRVIVKTVLASRPLLTTDIKHFTLTTDIKDISH